MRTRNPLGVLYQSQHDRGFDCLAAGDALCPTCAADPMNHNVSCQHYAVAGEDEQ